MTKTIANKLVLGAGPRYLKQKDEYLVDIRPFENVDAVYDLNKVPWPWDARFFIHVSAVHVVEHLHSLVNFMNECWRVLQPGGSLYLETPLAGANPDLEYADPEHIRCYRIHTFVNYFSLEGIERFGYTDKPWNFFHLKVVNDCIILHAYPIKR